MTNQPARDDRTEESYLERMHAAKAHAVAWTGVIYRAASPRYARSGDLVSGLGAMKVPGRWHPKGSFRVVYGAIEPEAAFAESLAMHRYYQLPFHLAMPKVVAAVRVDLSSVLDLTNSQVRRRLGYFIPVLTELDWRQADAAGQVPLTRQLGIAAHAAGLEALLVPSAALPRARNLVIFPDNLLPSSRLVAVGLDEAGAG